ncbi:MAG: c-type cytochrome [Enhygromyxa sp.]
MSMHSSKTKLVCISLLGGASLAALGFGGDDARIETEPIAVAMIEPSDPSDPSDPSEPTNSIEAAEVEPSSETIPASLAPTAGGVLAVDRHGLLIVERSAGELIRADREGQRRAGAKLSPGLGELVLDGLGRAYVADRGGDRVVRFDVDHPEQPRELASVAVGEPHGIALTPDGALLVTSVNEHALVVLDAETFAPRWEVELAPEPRAVAVSPDGSQAAVGFLSSGSLALVDLHSEGRRVRWQSLEPRDHVETVRDDYEGCYDMFYTRIVEARGRFSVPVETGRRYARNVYALAFASDAELLAPHQLATPQMQRVVAREAADSYGGQSADIKPIAHTLARVHGVDQLELRFDTLDLRVHQPRALAYDAEQDRLYVAGYGDDRIAAFHEVSGESPRFDWSTALALPEEQACGIDGLALDGEQLWVHCEFGRRVARLDLATRSSQIGEPLAESARSAQVELGAELFRRSDSRISDAGVFACSSCHPEGRSDGLTWRLGKSILQAPVLAGRVVETGPYKWDGQDPTLHASLRHTMARIGGGWPSWPSDAEIDAMVAYLESLPGPKPPRVDDPEALARGREVFVEASCDACHEGERSTDRNQHALDTTLARVDTPSLIGLAHSRPYFHDGSAPDLWTLLTDRGTVHDMADTSALSDAQLRDLVTYLESL